MDDFDTLLPQYERELALLRQGMERFEHEFPKAAVQLSLSGGLSDDPGVGRMMQGAAWLYARASQRIGDHVPEFTEAMLETVFPAYLQPVPSCSVAQFDVSRLFEDRTKTLTVPRGAELVSRPLQCRFSTAYDVTLAPLEITHARFAPTSVAPALNAGELPGDAEGILSVELASLGRRQLVPGSELLPRTLRIYLHGEPFFAAALTDAITLRPTTAFVEADGGRRWRALERTPLSAAGFGDGEALIEEPRHVPTQPALRQLIEYLAFPDKFRFVDLDLAALLRAAGPCARLTLHLPIAGPAASAQAVQRLTSLTRDHLRLFCTPIVNRFRVDAEPAEVKRGRPCYPVELPKPKKGAARATLHTIDAVRMMLGEEGKTEGHEIPPFHSFQHGAPVTMFWLRERDPLVARRAGSETAIKVVDWGQQRVVPQATTLAIKLTCTNGNVPAMLGNDIQGSSLRSESLGIDAPLTMPVSPSAPMTLPQDGESHWRLISALSPNPATLSASGLPMLQDLLRQFAKGAPQHAARFVDGIVGMDCSVIRPVMRVPGIPTPHLIPGIQITLTIDEAFFASDPRHTFALLMERYFLRYAGMDCMQLVVTSTAGIEIWRGEPLLGPAGQGML
jgi:type VI secretion system protein ImpG